MQSQHWSMNMSVLEFKNLALRERVCLVASIRASSLVSEFRFQSSHYAPCCIVYRKMKIFHRLPILEHITGNPTSIQVICGFNVRNGFPFSQWVFTVLLLEMFKLWLLLISVLLCKFRFQSNCMGFIVIKISLLLLVGTYS